MSTLVFLLLLLASLSTYAQSCGDDTAVCASGVFCSGFEEGNKDIWDDYDGNPDSTNLLMTDPGPCDLPNNTVMRLRVPAGTGGADLVKELPTTHDKLYARWYQKWEQGYDFSARNHGGGLHAGDRSLLGRSNYQPDGSDWYSTWIEPIGGVASLNGIPKLYTYYAGMYQDCADPNGTCFGDALPCMYDEGSNYCTKPQHRETVTPPAFQADTWYCIEIMLDGGTPTPSDVGADGQQDFWINGVEYGPWTDLWHRTTADLDINILWLNLYHHEAHSVEGVMLDNVVVSTQRIGCFSTQQIELSVPQNLRFIFP